MKGGVLERGIDICIDNGEGDLLGAEEGSHGIINFIWIECSISYGGTELVGKIAGSPGDR